MAYLLLLIVGCFMAIAWVFNAFDNMKRASKRNSDKLAAAVVRSGERREDIIERHVAALRESSNSYAAQDATVRTMLDVMVAEGAVREAPDSYERLYVWQLRNDVRQEYKDLSRMVEQQMRGRLRTLADEREAAERARNLAQQSQAADQLRNLMAEEVEVVEAIKERNKHIIDTFFSVAERKVATLDEYGDENWDALAAEVQRCVMKVGTREGVEWKTLLLLFGAKKAPEFWSAVFDGPGMKRWRILAEYLDAEFRRRHAARGERPGSANDISTMDGVEFERFVANVLKPQFSSVRGTPPTGDQGADLIAEKDGRTVIIQAKRYQRPVGNKAVQEVIAARTFYKGDEAWVVTNSTFTPSAIALAQSAGVRLVDGIELAKLTV